MNKRHQNSKIAEEDFVTTKFSCPNCNVELEAKKWTGKSKAQYKIKVICCIIEKKMFLFQCKITLSQILTKVAYRDDWILINVSGDVLLPCLKCMEKNSGVDWRLITPSGKELDEIHLEPRLRQHIFREHGMLAEDEDAKAMRGRALQIVCTHLHAQPENHSPHISEV